MKRIYMVYREGGDLPKVPHDTMDEAMDEANRLADKHPGDVFHVLATTAQAKADKPVIEVGDVVKWSEGAFSSMERIVTWAINKCPVAHVQFKTDIPEKANIADLTLIRKGPKVHTFGGVEFKTKEGSQYPTAWQDKHRITDIIGEIGITDNKKRYTLTLTEEVTK